MKQKKIEVNSPEYHDLIRKLTNSKLTLPLISNISSSQYPTHSSLEKLNKDEIITLALILDLPDLLNLCKTNKKFNRDICENKFFWSNKLMKDYPFIDITDVKEYKELYKYLTPRAREYEFNLTNRSKYGDVLPRDYLVSDGNRFISFDNSMWNFPNTNPLFWKNISNVRMQFFWVSEEIIEEAKKNSKNGLSYITGKYKEKYKVKTDEIEDSIKFKTPKFRWVNDHLEPITLLYI